MGILVAARPLFLRSRRRLCRRHRRLFPRWPIPRCARRARRRRSALRPWRAMPRPSPPAGWESPVTPRPPPRVRWAGRASGAPAWPAARPCGGLSDGARSRASPPHRRRLAVLKRQRQSWEPGWRDLSRFIKPAARPVLQFAQPGRPWRPGQRLDPRSHGAVRAAHAGGGPDVGRYLAGRPWFRLTIPDRRVASLARRSMCGSTSAPSACAWCSTQATSIRRCADLRGAGPVRHRLRDRRIRPRGRDPPLPLSTGEYWLASTGAAGRHAGAGASCTRTARSRSAGPITASRDTEKARGDDADSEIAILHMIEPNTGFEKGRLDWAGKNSARSTGARAPDRRAARRKASSSIAAATPSSRR